MMTTTRILLLAVSSSAFRRLRLPQRVGARGRKVRQARRKLIANAGAAQPACGRQAQRGFRVRPMVWFGHQSHQLASLAELVQAAAYGAAAGGGTHDVVGAAVSAVAHNQGAQGSQGQAQPGPDETALNAAAMIPMVDKHMSGATKATVNVAADWNPGAGVQGGPQRAQR